jgi:hypothetical protein
MLCIKILRDSTVIGAEEHEYPVYVNHPYYSNIPLRCEEESAQGILSLNQREIYHLVGRSSMPGDYLEAEIISKSEYEYIIEELDIPDEEEVEPDPDEGSGSDIMTAQQMRERIIDLENNIEEKDQRIDFLEDCLLEMSEAVHG